MCISVFDGRLRFEGGGSSSSQSSRKIELDDGCVPFPLFAPNLPEGYVESGWDFPLAFRVLASGSNAYTSTSDGGRYQCFPQRAWPLERPMASVETAKSLRVELVGKLRPGTGCSVGERLPQANP